MDTVSSSTSSLFLQDGSFVSLIDSRSTTPRHPYNTRLSVKLSSSNSTLIGGDGDASEFGKRPVVDLSKSNFLKSTTQSNFPSTMRRRNAPAIPYNEEEPTCMEKFCRYCCIFVTIACVILACTYLRHVLTESQGSSHSVNRELAKINTEMTGMKQDVQVVVASCQDTEKKLEVIEEVLRDLKKAAQKPKEAKKCLPKETPKSSVVNMKILDALQLYDEDKTGKPDYALESAGGRILGVRNTENYPSSATISFLGVTLCQSGNSARAMIQPGTLPGECWAFKGHQGSAIIQLLDRVKICSVSLEHLSKNISPTGDINTAPKEFSIRGLSSSDDMNGELLGKFVYDIEGPSLQHFEIDACVKPYYVIEFKVYSNHGHPEFTCVYRLRVHGTLENGVL